MNSAGLTHSQGMGPHRLLCVIFAYAAYYGRETRSRLHFTEGLIITRERETADRPEPAINSYVELIRREKNKKV